MIRAVAHAALPATLVLLTACATIEDGADHARTFVREHPLVSAVAGVVIGAVDQCALHRAHLRLLNRDVGRTLKV